MARATFHEVSLEIPDGWRDGTTILLVGPAPDTTSVPTTSKIVADAPNIVLRREELIGEATDLQVFAQAQEQLMHTLMPGVQVTGRGTVSVGAERIPGITKEFVLADGARTLAQLQVYWVVGRMFYALCGTANVGPGFAAVREEVHRIVAGLTFGP
jgi:hypothetical protein